MTPRDFETLLPLALALFAFRERGPGANVTPGPLPVPIGDEQPIGEPRKVATTRTGEPDVTAWARRRLALLLASMRTLDPPVPEGLLDRVGKSLLAQWAHETAQGRSEFNFNLGGWRARRRDPYFTARDVQSGAEVFRWTAYPSLPVAVEDQLRRLIVTFPSAWALLFAEPESSAWVEELGRKGYYTADPKAYARGWGDNLQSLYEALR